MPIANYLGWRLCELKSGVKIRRRLESTKTGENSLNNQRECFWNKLWALNQIMTESVCVAMSFIAKLMMMFGSPRGIRLWNAHTQNFTTIFLASLLALFPNTELLYSHLLCWLCEKSSTEWIKVFRWWWEDKKQLVGWKEKRRSMQAVGLLSLNLQNSFFTTYILSSPTPKHLCCELPNCLVMWF